MKKAKLQAEVSYREIEKPEQVFSTEGVCVAYKGDVVLELGKFGQVKLKKAIFELLVQGLPQGKKKEDKVNAKRNDTNADATADANTEPEPGTKTNTGS